MTPEQNENTVFINLLMKAVEAFGDRMSAYHFMERPHPFLDGKSPTQVIISGGDASSVERIIDGILYSLPM